MVLVNEDILWFAQHTRFSVVNWGVDAMILTHIKDNKLTHALLIANTQYEGIVWC